MNSQAPFTGQEAFTSQAPFPSQDAFSSQVPGITKHRQMTYDCGKCGRANDIKPREPVRCLECGYRIVFKQRTKKMVQFEAR